MIFHKSGQRELFNLETISGRRRMSSQRENAEIAQRMTTLMQGYIANGRSTAGPAQKNDFDLSIDTANPKGKTRKKNKTSKTNSERAREIALASVLVLTESTTQHIMKLIRLLSSLLCLPLLAAAADKPNVVIFLVDDMGYGDLGCYGNKIIHSPNLDHFASEAMRFTQGYAACAVCSPSRSAIQTGRTPYRNGVYNWIPEGRDMHLRSSEITIATLLKVRAMPPVTSASGISTACSIHLSSRSRVTMVMSGGSPRNAGPSHRDPNNFVRNGQPVGKLDGYSGQLVVNEAIDWLKHHRDAKKPFLLNVLHARNASTHRS